MYQRSYVSLCFLLLAITSACTKSESVEETVSADTTTETQGVLGSLKIASVASVDDQRKLDSRNVASTDLAPSSSNYSFAKIDGIKVNVLEVRGSDATSDNPLVTAAIDEEIELTDDPDALIALTKSIEWAVGDYSGIELRIDNSWSVKAYCKTQLDTDSGDYKLVYSTATGITTQDCNIGSDCTLPDDYDYYDYDFIDYYYTQNDSDPSLATHLNFSIAEGDSPVVSLLFDATNTVACWDGASWDSNSALGYFRGPDSELRPTLWPDSTPAFAVPVLPLMAYADASGTQGLPTARSFFTSQSASDLADPINFSETETVTLLYNSDDEVVAGGTRNLAGYTGDGPLDSNLHGFTANESGGIDIYASGWLWDGTSNPPVFIENKVMQSFELPETQYEVFSTTYVDGEDCGLELEDHNGNNPSRPCLGEGESGTLYWREAVR